MGDIAHVKQICLPTNNLPKKKDTAADFSTLCRTCAKSATFLTPIFSGDGLENNLPDLINKHLPIKVSAEDGLPQSLCYECAHTLVSWGALLAVCTDTDRRLQNTLTQSKLKVTNLKNESKDYKWIESTIDLIVKEVLTDYIQIQDREQVCLQFVCQKCMEQSQAVARLTEHINNVHLAEVNSEDDLKEFVRENITFEEILEDVGNELWESLVRENNELDKPDTEVTEDFENEHIEMATEKEDHVEKEFPDTKENIKNEQTAKKKEKVMKTEVGSSKKVKSEAKSRVTFSLHCPFCSCLFSTLARLQYHMSQHPDISQHEGIVCCGRDYDDKTQYLMHYQKKHVVFKTKALTNVCRACGFTAPSHEELKAHIASTHAFQPERVEPKRRKRPKPGARPPVRVSCPQCHKLLNKDSLRTHLKTHFESEKQVFECDKCGKKYSAKGNLVFHQRVAHEGQLRFACGACGEMFPSRHTRDRHARTHPGGEGGGTRVTCPRCHNTFHDKHSLRRHTRRVHLKLRPHACALCPKKFDAPEKLTRHMFVKHDVDDVE